MSNHFSASENTASALPVRLDVLSLEGQNVPPTSPARPRVISSIGIPPAARTKTLLLLVPSGHSATYNEEQPQLTERDSIFATHYLNSDSTATTPRLHPTQAGTTTFPPASQDDAAVLALPKPLFPQSSDSATYSHKARTSSPIAVARKSEKNISLRRVITQRSQSTGGTSQKPYNKKQCDPDEDADEIITEGSRTGDLSYRHRFEDEPHVSRSPSGLPNYTRMSTCHDEAASETNGTKGNVFDGLENTTEAKWSTDKNRSSSRSRHAHVDKSIEATLANAEPAVNARSRKASHYMRLFKENTALQEPSQGQDRVRTRSTIRGGGSSANKSDGADLQLDDGLADDSTKYVRDSEASSAVKNDKHPESSTQDDARMLRSSTEDGIRSRPSQNASARPSSTRSLSNKSNHPHTSDETGTVSSVIGSNVGYGPEKAEKGGLPLRLLEEIRNHHNLAPPFHDKFRSSHATSQAVVDSVVDHEAATPTLQRRQSGDVSDQFRKSEAATHEEYEDESDKEQISSALYYPHQAPNLVSADRMVTGDIDEQGSPDQGATVVEADTQPLRGDLDENDLNLSGEIGIALQSRDENRYLHGDLQRPRAPSSESQPKSYESGASSASDSDYESWDESAHSGRGDEFSLTDDGETTPTATPTPYPPYPQDKVRRVHRAPAVPLGAVELKPYNHQVGGHTTVFRFSKRAVCKQLSNRENEFYEVIERRHPKMLNFLPRYAWTTYPLPVQTLQLSISKDIISVSDSPPGPFLQFADEVLLIGI